MSQTLTFDEALSLAVSRHQQGDVSTAEQIYRQLLPLAPQHPDVVHLLGVACRQQNRFAEALPLLQQAHALAPDNPDILSNYGEALIASGQPAQAEAPLRQALKLQPGNAQALNNLGLSLHQQGRTEQAIAAGRKAVAAAPEHANARNNLGSYLLEHGRHAEAHEQFIRAHELEPGNPNIITNLALAWEKLGQPHTALELLLPLLGQQPNHASSHAVAGRLLWQRQQHELARQCLERAVELEPGNAGSWSNLGLTRHDQGELAAAVAAFQQAIALQPDDPGHRCNLGITLKAMGQISEAIAVYQTTLQQHPTHAASWSNLGMALEVAGRADEAVAAYTQAVTCNPALDRAASNHLFALNYLPAHHPGADPTSIAAAHRQWAERYVAHLYPTTTPTQPPAPRPRTAGERLRVGLVSPDLHNHPVAWLLLPYLRHHDRQRIDLFIYDDQLRADDITATCQALCPQWRNIGGRSHAEVAELIRADGIDLLVDLAGHTDRHRLPVFALRPAARQASWIGYFNTTGLATIDGFVTDPWTTPAAWAPCFSEQLWSLPASRFCYEAPAYCPPVTSPPLLQQGHLTFGCFNNLAKLNEEVITCWAALLAQVPESRLRLKARALDDAGVRQDWQERITRHFAAHSIDPARLELRGYSLHADMLAEYAEVDIALDPFPFGGGMTSCEALWMGVPVLTLAGQTVAGRQTHSLLHALDLPEWSTANPEDYVRHGATLANGFLAQPEQLATLRHTLRPRFAASAAGDAPAFARAVDDLWWQYGA